MLAVITELGHAEIAAQLKNWVHNTDDLPLQELLASHGVTTRVEPAGAKLGLRVQESQGLQIKTVLRGGPTEQAGMMAGDEWLAIEVNGQRWRITKLDDAAVRQRLQSGHRLGGA